MKLTSKSEYALLAMVFLARNHGKGMISVQKIAEAQGIPPKFLEQILLILKRARFLKSMKGHDGGYSLSIPPEKVNLAQIIRLFDGALAPTESVSKYFYEPTPVEKEKGIVKVLKNIRDYVSDKLENTTLRDVI